MELEPHAIASMLITLGALLLFTRERIPLEYSCVAVLFILVLGFELFPYYQPEPTAIHADDAELEEPGVRQAQEPQSAENQIAAGQDDPARGRDDPAPRPDDRDPANGDPRAQGEPDDAAARDVPLVLAPDGPLSGEDTAAPDGTRNVLLRGSDFLRGFGNEALLTICLLLIVAKGVEVSGALRPLGRILARIWLFNRTLAMLATLVVAAFISAFANNTPIVVMLLPILVGVAHRIGMPPSRMLLPVGFATIIGGMSTTIGTSTNLLVVSVSSQLGGPSFDMFDFILPASLAAVGGIFYLWLIAPRLLPDRASPLAGSAPRIFHSVVDVNDDSPFAGQTLADVMRLMGGQIRIERVQRGAGLELVRLPSLQLRAGDKLHVRGTPEAIKKIHDSFGGGFQQSDLLRTPDQRLVEIVVTQASPLHRKRLSELRSATLGKLFPVGLHRAGRQTMMPIEESGDPVLDTGDVLLMQGHRRDIQELRDTAHLLILDRNIPVPRTAKAPLAIALLLAVVLAAALGIVPIMVSALSGAAVMLIGRVLAWDEAWSALDTRLVLVIVTSLALGTSLSVTGAADFLARSFVTATQDLPPALVISSLLLVTAMLTEIVTNNAVAVIATPIAISVANQLDLPATPFVLAVLFGANMSYIMPIGYQTNLLVFSAGGYRFSDFFRAGIPMQILLWVVLSIALPLLYL